MLDADSLSLIGMITDDSIKSAVARPIVVLLEKLREWGIEVDLDFDPDAAHLAEVRTLGAYGYSLTASSLAQALQAADARALRSYVKTDLSASMVSEAMRLKESGAQEYAIQRYFANSVDDPEKLNFMTQLLARSSDRLDPNVLVPHVELGEEAILNAAARAGNSVAVDILLKAGANPNAYQRMDGAPYEDLRFLLPFVAAFKATNLSESTRMKLVDSYVRAGAVVPALPPAPRVKDLPQYDDIPNSRDTEMYGAVAGAFDSFARTYRSSGRSALPETPDICASAPQSACAKASKAYGIDWCDLVRKTPRLIGHFVPPLAEKSELPPLAIRYFLGADSRAAYLLAEELTLYPGYAVLEITASGREIHAYSFAEQHPLGAPGCVQNARLCWDRYNFTIDQHGQMFDQYHRPVPSSGSCESAKIETAQRVAELKKMRRRGGV